MGIAANLLQRVIAEARTFRRSLLKAAYLRPKVRDDVINQFHRLYYESEAFGETWNNTTFLGVRITKCPLDLWIYQEIIFELRPDVIIETGTCYGGSALYIASVCDLVDHGRIVTIDIDHSKPRPEHKRITYITGSSTADHTLQRLYQEIEGNSNNVMVILDSDHKKDHVLKELAIYSKLVTVGNYLIVEDSNVNGHPVLPEHGPGPMEAIEEFIQVNDGFRVDRTREKLLMTCNPSGYLRREK